MVLISLFMFLNFFKSYQKTSAGLKTATQKITPAFSTFGGTMKNSLGSLRYFFVNSELLLIIKEY